MIFRIQGNKVVCSRTGTPDGTDEYEVVEFDTHLKAAAPHLLALLTDIEIKELKVFLVYKQSVNSSTQRNIIFETLSAVIDEAREAVKIINDHDFRALRIQG